MNVAPPLPFTMSEDEVSNSLRMLLWGPPGAGKTWLAASAVDVEEMSPVAFINLDRGTKTIRTRQGISVFTLPTSHSADGWEELKKLTDWLLTKDHGFKTVIFDSLDGLHTLIQKILIKVDSLKKPERDMDVATELDWYRGMNRFTSVLDLYKQYATFNFICTCSSQLKTDAQTTLKFYKFALPVGLAEPTAGAFDLVAFMKAEYDGKVTKRIFQTVETSKVTVAKDRNIINKPMLENPTMQDIWSEMKEVERQRTT